MSDPNFPPPGGEQPPGFNPPPGGYPPPPAAGGYPPQQPPAGFPPPAAGGYPPPQPPMMGGNPAAAGYTIAPGVERAEFLPRFLGRLIDMVIFAVPYLLISQVSSLLAFVLVIAGIFYWLYLEGGPAGQTVGKKIMNIRVVSAETGGPLGWGGAAIRYVCNIVAGIPYGLGFLWMLWDPEKMTWHDKWSKTVVVSAATYPPPADGFGKPPS